MLDRLPWIAPECYDGDLQHMTPDKDLYAFGTTLWELFSGGERPYASLTPAQVGHLPPIYTSML